MVMNGRFAKKQSEKGGSKKEFINIEKNIKKLCIKMSKNSNSSSIEDLKVEDFYKFDLDGSKTI